MKATGDVAAKKFEEYVKLASGNSLLVYQALNELKNPTDQDIADYIFERLKP